MPKPPPPPRPARKARAPSTTKPGAEPLAEVERALSILHGRHPEAVRADRETQAALAAKRSQTEALAARAGRSVRRARLLRLGIGALLLGLVVASGRSLRRRFLEGRAVNAALDRLASPYFAAGFVPESRSRFVRTHEDLADEKAACFIALASEAATLLVDRASGTISAEESMAWCSCGEKEKVTVRLRDPDRGAGLLVLRADANDVGGGDGLRFLVQRPHFLAPAEECSSGSLDAWLKSGRAPASALDHGEDASLVRRLERQGFHLVASAPPPLPFAIVPASRDACTFAMSTGPDDVLSLRLEGGTRPLSGVKGTIVFCARNLATFTVWREGAGELFVESIPSARVGGAHGSREVSERIGLGPPKVWVSPEDLAWDATSTLLASGVPLPEIAASSDGHAAANASLLALSIGGAMVRPDVPNDEGYLCDPPLAPATTDAICVQTKALAWRAVGSVGRAGIAVAPFPFWMQTFTGAGDGGLSAELRLLRFGRRLIGEGYEPTTLDGVTELPDGARITGRAGDDAVIAIQIAREDPWVFACSDAETPSSVEDPKIVSLAPGAQIKVVCLPRANGPTSLVARRTVVFRRPSVAEK